MVTVCWPGGVRPAAGVPRPQPRRAAPGRGRDEAAGRHGQGARRPRPRLAAARGGAADEPPGGQGPGRGLPPHGGRGGAAGASPGHALHAGPAPALRR